MACLMTIHYRLAMPKPTSHYFVVDAIFDGEWSDPCDVMLPAWTPGSYLIRDFSRHVVDVQAWVDQRPAAITKVDKATWRVADCFGRHTVRVRYRVWAYELSVRTSHLDDTHAYINGASVFVYHRQAVAAPLTLTIEPPPGWHVTTALTPVVGSRLTYQAANYDELVDSPIEIGTTLPVPFDVAGVPHELVVWGESAPPYDRLISDLKRVIAQALNIFGTLPFPRYVFILHVTDQGGGGLEHRNSASILMPRSSFWEPDGYLKMLKVFAHEYFHLWNVKRLRPQSLGPFDYQRENYTPLLWALEGITDYYALLLLVRSGVMPTRTFLNQLADLIKMHQQTPGRLVESVAAASFDAWIKFYRPDANTLNTTISYYLRGALAGLFLDLTIRQLTNGQATLDTVFQRLWQQYGDRGYPPDAFERTAIEVAGESLQRFFAAHIHGTEEWDWSTLATVGLQLTATHSAEPSGTTVALGIRVTDQQGRLKITQVMDFSPAQAAGLAPDDELIAIGGIRTTAKNWLRQLAPYRPGDTVSLTVFRRDQLITRAVVAAHPDPDQWLLKPLSRLNPPAMMEFVRWTHQAYPPLA
jgi:predicted metalloprotease with PDZ domain